MAKYRRIRKVVANILAEAIFFGSKVHAKIKVWLCRLQEVNLLVWKKMSLWTVKLYAWILPNNSENQNDD